MILQLHHEIPTQQQSASAKASPSAREIMWFTAGKF